jgi:hypothetical protein
MANARLAGMQKLSCSGEASRFERRLEIPPIGTKSLSAPDFHELIFMQDMVIFHFTLEGQFIMMDSIEQMGWVMTMRQIRVYHMDAFTRSAFEGNPAGVVPDASNLTLTEMHNISNQLNLLKTAFLLPPTDPKADLRVRYFTPQEEINFCGHATFASVFSVQVGGFAHVTLEGYLRLLENWGHAHD